MAKKTSYLIEYIDRYKKYREVHRDDDENGDSSGDEMYVAFLVFVGLIASKLFSLSY